MSPALLGEAMIERAKTVVVVASRVDEDQAAQILLDAADRARIPVRIAADQVMTALQDGDDLRGGITQDMLVQALGCVRPVEPDPSSDPRDPRDEDNKPLPTGPPAHQAA
ncbi:ANTAR domain-containing protein [Promicromonospora sp. CA-289599]|uniref:ANTAR domain-containing protein n=1 Tax=Promicromonospora sp. CA-289599 TaxID=3240014 RepID=UPI003D94BDA1